jgi:hypothetical protein
MGGKNIAQLTVDESVTAVLNTIASVQPKDSGRFVDRDGKDIPY